MSVMTFESRVLPDGHLYCPEELARREGARLEVKVEFEDSESTASDRDIEESAIRDLSDELLSQEELDYYLSLKEA